MRRENEVYDLDFLWFFKEDDDKDEDNKEDKEEEYSNSIHRITILWKWLLPPCYTTIQMLPRIDCLWGTEFLEKGAGGKG